MAGWLIVGLTASEVFEVVTQDRAGAVGNCPLVGNWRLLRPDVDTSKSLIVVDKVSFDRLVAMGAYNGSIFATLPADDAGLSIFQRLMLARSALKADPPVEAAPRFHFTPARLRKALASISSPGADVEHSDGASGEPDASADAAPFTPRQAVLYSVSAGKWRKARVHEVTLSMYGVPSYKVEYPVKSGEYVTTNGAHLKARKTKPKLSTDLRSPEATSSGQAGPSSEGETAKARPPSDQGGPSTEGAKAAKRPRGTPSTERHTRFSSE